MSESHERLPEGPAEESAPKGGENVDPESRGEGHEGAPHDTSSDEPLGPMTPDDERPLGDTPEAHDEIIPEDLPKDHPGRAEAERQASTGDGTVRGNV